MKRLALAALILTLPTLGFAKAAKIKQVVCTMTEVKGEQNSISTTLDLTKLTTKNSVYVYAEDGLDYGKYNFNFGVDASTDGKTIDMSVIFNENNSVQDEVGSLSCEVPKTPGVFCEDQVDDFDGKAAFSFSCEAQ